MHTENKPDDSPVTKLQGLEAALSNVVPQRYDRLPIAVQAAIAHYMAVVGEAWGQDASHEIWSEWSYGGAVPGNISEADALTAMSQINRFLPSFRATYGHWEFCYANVPTFELCVVAMRYALSESNLLSRLDIEFIFGEAPTNQLYATPGWPILLSANLQTGGASAVIENGEQRLMRYVADNEKTVPCVWFPNKRQPLVRKEPSIKTLVKQVQELTAVVEELRGLPKRIGALETVVHALPRS